MDKAAIARKRAERKAANARAEKYTAAGVTISKEETKRLKQQARKAAIAARRTAEDEQQSRREKEAKKKVRADPNSVGCYHNCLCVVWQLDYRVLSCKLRRPCGQPLCPASQQGVLYSIYTLVCY